jgi:hypothetical protein
MRWIFIPLVASILLAGCATGEVPTPVKPIILKREPIARPPLNLPSVDKITSEKVTWTIVTPANVDDVFAKMIAKGIAPALFTVTSDGYEQIAINTQGAIGVILQQTAVIDGYRTYYVLSEKNITAYNANR